MPNQEGAEPQTSKVTKVQHRIRSPSGTNEHDTQKQSKFSEYGSLCASRETVHFQSNWLKITQDRLVLNTIQGYMIDFLSQPHQQSVPQPPQFFAEQTQLISMEITELLHGDH